jgi:hypothetical protein
MGTHVSFLEALGRGPPRHFRHDGGRPVDTSVICCVRPPAVSTGWGVPPLRGGKRLWLGLGSGLGPAITLQFCDAFFLTRFSLFHQRFCCTLRLRYCCQWPLVLALRPGPAEGPARVVGGYPRTTLELTRACRWRRAIFRNRDGFRWLFGLLARYPQWSAGGPHYAIL